MNFLLILTELHTYHSGHLVLAFKKYQGSSLKLEKQFFYFKCSNELVSTNFLTQNHFSYRICLNKNKHTNKKKQKHGYLWSFIFLTFYVFVSLQASCLGKFNPSDESDNNFSHTCDSCLILT